MFKNLLAVFLVTITALPVLAIDNVPTWDEFCPPQYLNAVPEYNKPKKVSTKNVILGALFGPLATPFLSKAIDNANNEQYIQELNYWNTRKQVFEKSVNTCLADNNNQSLCFMKVRELEIQKNNQYRYDQSRKYNAVIQTYYDLHNQQLIDRNHRDLNGIETQLNNINTQLFLQRQ